MIKHRGRKVRSRRPVGRRDVQQLAGHASLQTTRRYVEGGTDAKRRLIAMI